MYMINNNLTKNSIILSIGTIFNKGLQFLMVILFSRWLSTEDYGIFDLVCTYVALLVPIVTLSSNNAVFRFSVDSDNKEKYITNGIILNIINLIFLSIIMLLIKIIFKWNLAIPLLLLSISEILNIFFRGYLRGIKKLNIYSLSMMINTIFILFFLIIFIKFFDMNLNGLIYAYVLGYMICNLMVFIITKFWKYFNIKLFSHSIIIEMCKYSSPLIFNDISWWIVNTSDRVIINMFLGALYNGIYAVAYKIPNLCTSIFGVFNIAWQETAVEIKDLKERNIYYNNVYNKIIVILLTICSLILSLNFILFKYFFEIRYVSASYYAPILITSVIFNILSLFFGSIQISLKQPKQNAISTIIGAILNILIHLVLIKFIGLFAACISTLLSTLIIVFIRKYMLKKDVSVSLEKSNCIYLLLYCYFVICSVLWNKISIIINIVNFIIACSVFLYINRNIILKLIKK